MKNKTGLKRESLLELAEEMRDGGYERELFRTFCNRKFTALRKVVSASNYSDDGKLYYDLLKQHIARLDQSYTGYVLFV